NWFEFFRKFCLMLEKNFLNFKFNVNNTNKRGNTTVYFGKKSNYLFLTDFIKKHNLPALNRKWKIQYAT
ncbi:MAG: hypothetical protein Q8O88_02240, partial [bacterium]|nr:hypothetical protein [bacterium]